MALIFLCHFNYRIKELQIIQNRCMRIILKCDRYTSVQYMLNILQLMDVKTRIIYNTLVTIYKIKNKLMPNYLLSKVTYNSNLHRYSLRNNNGPYHDTLIKFNHA
jgi:hypothetical protein